MGTFGIPWSAAAREMVVEMKKRNCNDAEIDKELVKANLRSEPNVGAVGDLVRRLRAKGRLPQVKKTKPIQSLRSDTDRKRSEAVDTLIRSGKITHHTLEVSTVNNQHLRAAISSELWFRICEMVAKDHKGYKVDSVTYSEK
jgi:hypothetical protein